MKKTTLTTLLLSALFVNISFAQPEYIYTVAGHTLSGHTGDGGLAIYATFGTTYGTALDAAGNIYIADFGNAVIRKIDISTGIIHTIVGILDSAGFAGDGGPATSALLNGPTRVLVDAIGNIYINDDFNYRIRKVDTSGIITTVAGDGTGGDPFSNGILATSVWLGVPTAIALDDSGNLYVATWGTVRKINSAGIINTVAGSDSFGYGGDGGPADSALMYTVTGLAFDASGNLYMSDQQNQRIRKVNTSGIISTIAGNGTAGHSGDGALATLATIKNPMGLAFDAAGNLLFIDYENNVIRKIDTLGIITTFAGGTLNDSCYDGEGTLADTTCIHPNLQLAINDSGFIYFGNGNRESVIKPTHPSTGIEQFAKETILLVPNPSSGKFIIQTKNNQKNTKVEIYNMVGEIIYTSLLTGPENNIDISNQPAGNYFVNIRSAETSQTFKITINK